MTNDGAVFYLCTHSSSVSVQKLGDKTSIRDCSPHLQEYVIAQGCPEARYIRDLDFDVWVCRLGGLGGNVPHRVWGYGRTFASAVEAAGKKWTAEYA